MGQVRRTLNSFRVALTGIKHALQERHVRFHLFMVGAVTLAGFYFDLKVGEWCAIILAFGMVLAAELLNCAIEELADVVRDENHLPREATRVPRDVAAGAVLLASLSSAVIGLLIFLPKILAWLSNIY